MIMLCLSNLSCRHSPRKSNVSRAVTGEYYTVKKGDTLYGISRKFNISMNRLIQINDLKNPDVLSTGQRIYISGSVQDKNRTTSKTSKTISNTKKKISRPEITRSNTKSKPARFLVKPASAEITHSFGQEFEGLNIEGVYFAAKGMELRSAAPGMVVYVDDTKGEEIIIVEHGNNYYTVYSGSLDVSIKMGEKVSQSQVIGKINSERLYFELRKYSTTGNPVALDPTEYFRD